MLGYFLAILVGLSLGLLGGGGSILTVPILVYVMGIDPKISITLSLGIVGATGIIGVIGHLKNKNVDFKKAGLFIPFAMVGTYLGTLLSTYMSAQLQLTIFAVIMLLASVLMLKERSSDEAREDKKIGVLFLLQALSVGIITGVVGVGGGFLIVPALVLLGGLPMKKAVGTSLLIICVNSFTGFASYLNQYQIDWVFFFSFVGFSSLGVFIGSYLTKFFSQEKLKKAFAIFLVVMGTFILLA